VTVSSESVAVAYERQIISSIEVYAKDESEVATATNSVSWLVEEALDTAIEMYYACECADVSSLVNLSQIDESVWSINSKITIITEITMPTAPTRIFVPSEDATTRVDETYISKITLMDARLKSEDKTGELMASLDAKYSGLLKNSKKIKKLIKMILMLQMGDENGQEV
jgi:hypothetical protein